MRCSNHCKAPRRRRAPRFAALEPLKRRLINGAGGRIRWKWGWETLPLRQRTGTADKGDPAGRPYGNWELASRRADTWVRPYGFTGWKLVPLEIPPNPPLEKGGIIRMMVGSAHPTFAKDGGQGRPPHQCLKAQAGKPVPPKAREQPGAAVLHKNKEHRRDACATKN